MGTIYSVGTGLVSADWMDSANWVGGVVPLDANLDVGEIVTGDNFMEVPYGESAISVQSGATVDANNGYIQDVYGTVTDNNGTIMYVQPGGLVIGNNWGYYIDTVYYGGQVTNNYGDLYYLLGYCYDNFGYMYVIDYDYTNGTGYGYLDINDGTMYDIYYSSSYIGTNNGYAGYINGVIYYNYSTVSQVNGGGIIYSNESTGTALMAPGGQVQDNYGYVYNVAGTVTTNYSGGTIDNGDNDGGWGGYFGIVNENQLGGTININGGNNTGGIPSIVDNNYGEIIENYGIVTNNKQYMTGVGGIIYRNGYNGTSPSAWVETNEADAVVHKNEYGGTVNNNYGEVHQQDGYITTNYSGAKVLFSSCLASPITDAVSGDIYEINPNAFSYLSPQDVVDGNGFYYDEEYLSTYLPITLNGMGVTITEY